MNKRITIVLLVLLGAVLFLANTAHSQMKLISSRIEMNGEVKLAWTKPLSAGATTQYQVYRALLPDTSAAIVATTSDTVFVDHVPPVISPLPQTFAYKVVAKTGLVIEQSNILLVPVPGIPVIGGFRLEGKFDHGKIKLGWQQPIVGNVSYYLVYRGKLGDMAPTHTQIDSTTNLYSVTDAPMVPGMSSYTTYVFYVKAKLTNGDVIVSTTVQITISPNHNRDELKFVSVPPPYAQKDVPYLYTAKAVSGDAAAVIRYSGAAYNQMGWTVMEQFSIDSVSGQVQWTPVLKGSYKVVIIARSNKGGTAKQEFIVFVSGGNGIIQGKVTDTTNANIPNVIVEVFKTENNNALSFAYSAKTDNNGNYRISRVDPGIYKIKANAPSGKYQSQWYEGKRDVTQADPVTVEDSAKSGPTIVHFKLRGGVLQAPKVTVTGTVTDSAGVVINDAETRVVFVRAEFALNLGGSIGIGMENFRKYFDFNRGGDFRLDGKSEFVFHAKTDSLGVFSLQLPPGGYIALAKAKGYAVEFYPEQSNILMADVIRVQGDLSGISFTLAPLPPVVLGAISGSVTDSVNDVIVPSRVIAFRDGWRFTDMHRVGKVYVTDTDSAGMYRFDEVVPGNYVIMALPLGNYAPAFYSNDTLNNRWKRASKVTVNGNSVDNINIYVRPFGPAANGYTAITGTVSVNGNGVNGSFQSGAIVYAYRDGQVVGYSLTNVEGKYAITGLTPGQYSVVVDKAGYEESATASVTASYDLSGNPAVATANFTINAVLSAGTAEPVLPKQFLLEQNYPNPFNPTTTIAYTVPSSSVVSLKVYNLVGQEVATIEEGFREAGSYHAVFTANGLSSGVYFYRLQTGAYREVKKMMLVK